MPWRCSRERVYEQAMILNSQREVRVSLKALETFLQRARRELRLGKESVTVCLVSDAEIARLNRAYRKKSGPTDVLSFPANQQNGAGLRNGKRKAGHDKNGYAGDIAISPATAKRKAGRFGRTLEDELKILVLHGALHLLGYDHEADEGEMERVEARLRRRLGIDCG